MKTTISFAVLSLCLAASSNIACMQSDVEQEEVTVDAGRQMPPADAGTPPTDSGPRCGAGAVWCGAGCTDTQTDTANCGDCGLRCATGQACRVGSCVTPTPTPPPTTCATGQTACGTTCCTLATDTMNCGSCGHACATAQTCAAGACVTPPPSCPVEDAYVVSLSAAMNSSCPGGMRIVIHGNALREPARPVSAGSYADEAYGTPRYFGGQGEALRLTVARGLWSTRELRWSGYCPTTGAWLESGDIDGWRGFNTAAAAGAHFLINGVNIASSCRVAQQPFGERPYPSCPIPAPAVCH